MNTLYIDDTTTPLTYTPSTSTLSASKTVAHGAGKAAHSVASGFTHMLYMGGAALVGIIILKMTVFK